MCEIRLCSPSQICPSFTSQGGLVGLVAGIVVVVVGAIVVVVVVSIVVVVVHGISVVVPSVPMVVVPAVPAVVVSIAVPVVPMVVSGMGGQGHSEKEGELGPQMQSGHSSTKSQLASK